jgi:putative addiction module component (TIGR02574 family)
MDETLDQTVVRILGWPARWRAFLAEVLLDSLDQEPVFPLSPAWQQEIQRRLADLDGDAVTPIPADEVLTELRALT